MRLSGKNDAALCKIARNYSNRKNLSANILEIKKNLTRRAHV